MPDAFRLVIGTLTAIPVPPPRAVHRRTAGAAMLLAPLSALLLLAPGLVLVLLLRPWDHPALALPVAVVLIGGLALGTRALHLDGLADTVDGLAASYDRDRALAVMRTGDVGPAGAAALVLVLLLQGSCLAVLLHSPRGAFVAGIAVLASRLALTCACAGGQPARADGLGATVIGSVAPAAAAAVTAVLATAAALATGLAGSAPVDWMIGPAVLGCAVLSGLGVRRAATRRIGGLTGDVLGAIVELACAAALLVGAVVITLD